MSCAILFVDDEPNVLSAYTRLLRKRFEFSTALGGEEALRLIEDKGPFAVIVADMRMPGMNGVELLAKVRQVSPDTVRIMLTGNADQQTAIDAVNKGSIFKFLNKPCDSDTLIPVLEDALRQYQLVTAEKELLEQTLKGSIEMMVELLGFLDPKGFGKAQQLGHYARKVGEAMEVPGPWYLEVAAILSQIGILTIPAGLMAKMRAGGFLHNQEREIANRVPEIGSNLIRHIPRMESVAQSILYMNKNWNGTGFPADGVKEQEIPLGSRILRAVSDYLDHRPRRSSPLQALADLKTRTAWYDSSVLQALEGILAVEEQEELKAKDIQTVHLDDLKIGQLLVEGVYTMEGLLVVPEGTVLGVTHLEKLRNFAQLVGLQGSIRVVD